MKISTQLREVMDSLQVIPRMDRLEVVCIDACRRNGYDEQLAPIWAEKLRFTYAKVFETKYPEYMAANGDVLPIDTIDAAATEWEYYLVDQAGYADWIDDDGHVAPSGAIKARRFTGPTHELGHRWDMTVFDLERAAKSGLQLSSMKQKNAKRTHDAATNWVWLFGDSSKNLPGLCNHPNIQITVAPLKATPGTVRVWDSNATNDEIASDVSLLIDTVAESTLEAYHAAKVYMPPALFRVLRNRVLPSTASGFASLLQLLQDRYKGDETGQGKVTFHTLNECDGSRRLNPKTGSDDSGITGDFLLALPPDNKDELAFVRARPYTQRPPQERDLIMHHLTHSKIGGCKCQIPLAVHRLDFLA